MRQGAAQEGAPMLTYKDLLLTGPEAVCVLDAELEIRQHNQLASLLLGYRNKSLTGQHLSDILYDDIPLM